MIYVIYAVAGLLAVCLAMVTAKRIRVRGCTIEEAVTIFIENKHKAQLQPLVVTLATLDTKATNAVLQLFVPQNLNHVGYSKKLLREVASKGTHVLVPLIPDLVTWWLNEHVVDSDPLKRDADMAIMISRKFAPRWVLVSVQSVPMTKFFNHAGIGRIASEASKKNQPMYLAEMVAAHAVATLCEVSLFIEGQYVACDLARNEDTFPLIPVVRVGSDASTTTTWTRKNTSYLVPVCLK